MKKELKDAAIKAGRMQLAAWLHAAEAHGTIYYVIESVSRSGMSRKISLATIRMSRARKGEKRKPELAKLWPSLPPAFEVERAGANWSECLDAIGADWGFSWTARAFNVGGCGMDMVFALIDGLAAKAGLRGEGLTGKQSYANRVRRESF